MKLEYYINGFIVWQYARIKTIRLYIYCMIESKQFVQETFIHNVINS